MVRKTPVLSQARPILRQLAILALLACLFNSLSSCAQKPDPVLRVATNVWPGYETLYLARSLGLYDQSSIKLVEMTSASQVSHAIRNGTIEVAALTLDETLNLIQDRSVDLRVVLVMDISDGADALIARTGVANLADLAGKKIGVENGATGAIVLDAALQNANLQAHQVDIVPLTVNNHLTAWKQNQIDAVITFDPVRSALLNSGGHQLFDSSQIPGRILDVLVARTDAIEANPAALKTLIAGHFSALDYLSSNPDDAATRMAGRLATSANQVLAQFKGLKQPDLAENRHWLSGEEAALHQSARDLAQLMYQHRLLQHPITLGPLAESKFLPDGHNE